jgi:hypothetical protein
VIFPSEKEAINLALMFSPISSSDRLNQSIAQTSSRKGSVTIAGKGRTLLRTPSLLITASNLSPGMYPSLLSHLSCSNLNKLILSIPNTNFLSEHKHQETKLSGGVLFSRHSSGWRASNHSLDSTANANLISTLLLNMGVAVLVIDDNWNAWFWGDYTQASLYKLF